ncbi:MAG: glycosyltransferase family 4 protein [Ferruginibacter sp.]
MSVPKILFISHESSRSGAPLLLVKFIRWLVKEGKAKPVMLINRRGVLDHEFKALGKTYFFYQKRSSIGRNLFYKASTRLHNSANGKRRYMRRLKDRLSASKPDLIWSNTIGNGEIISFCQFLRVPVITHVHESRYVIGLLGEENFGLNKQLTDHFIACSDVVERDLSERSIPASAISLIYSSVDPGILQEKHPLEDPNKVLQHALSNRYPIIGGSGGEGLIKGTDLIISLVEEIRKTTPGILFIWVGGDLRSAECMALQATIEEKGLENNIYITGPVADAMVYFSLFNVFVLLSRTDSFPLACLENGLLGNPFVCFRDRVGVQVLLDHKFEENIIPFLDIPAMAERINELLKDPGKSKLIGAEIKKTILEKYTNDVCFPLLNDVIAKHYSKRSVFAIK